MEQDKNSARFRWECCCRNRPKSQLSRRWCSDEAAEAHTSDETGGRSEWGRRTSDDEADAWRPQRPARGGADGQRENTRGVQSWGKPDGRCFGRPDSSAISNARSPECKTAQQGEFARRAQAKTAPAEVADDHSFRRLVIVFTPSMSCALNLTSSP